MCHGDDHSLGLTGQIEYVEWESLKDKLASSMLGQWILRRSLQDSGDRIVNGVRKGGGA
jgi:hypothetical protein